VGTRPGKLISVVTGCFNEVENVEPLYRAVQEIFAKRLPGYRYEHIFIDNSSTDGTADVLRRMAREDRRVKVIVNARNFGHIRSPYHGLLQARGDAVIYIVADFQDPPELIPEFVKKWEEGYKVVVGIKKQSAESPLFFAMRRLYYRIAASLSEVELLRNFTGYGIYDRRVLDAFRCLKEPYPYFRGLISEVGFAQATIEYSQPPRRRGLTKNNLYTLFDMAMLGITSHSKVPLRIATMMGFGIAMLSLLVAAGYAAYKLVFWQEFTVGIAPMVIGIFFFASVQLFFTGIIGEYIGNIHTRIMDRPLVVELERLNFEYTDDGAGVNP
jgi:glycosyltransferase involved in cell wall biosynthesis